MCLNVCFSSSATFGHSSFFICPLRSSCHRRNEHQHSKHRLHLRSKHGTSQSSHLFGARQTLSLTSSRRSAHHPSLCCHLRCHRVASQRACSMQEVHANLNPQLLHTSGRASSQPVLRQPIHDPSLASHPQTRPVIIASQNDQARQGTPLQCECVCVWWWAGMLHTTPVNETLGFFSPWIQKPTKCFCCLEQLLNC